MSDSVFSNNNAWFGGAIDNFGSPSNRAKLSIEGDSFTDNTGYIGGGAIYDGTTTNTSLSHYSTSGATVTGTDSQFTGNTSNRNGGGILVAGGALSISKGSLFQGDMTSDAGGAIAVLGGQATIEGVTLYGNTAGTEGGAIENAGAVTLLDSTVALNSAGDGGGVANLTTVRPRAR